MSVVNLVITVVNDAVNVLAVLIIVRSILSWIPSVDYEHPVIRPIMRITDPILRPVRRLMPPVGGIDLSPIIAIMLVLVLGQLLLRIIFWLVYGT